ncbi:MAG: antitoxin VbhA family protein [Methanomassiliicoccaceae archaeon]|nr:antitoxin VbhA family protein [Methanomassiliicoccaceae archaeon]
MYSQINVDRRNLSIMGVPFPDAETLESTAAAIGSNMFEGFRPTRKGIEIIRDYCLGKLTIEQLAVISAERSYE